MHVNHYSLNDNTLYILNVCWNNVFRNVFKMNRWESVKMVQFYCGRIDFIHIHHFEKLKFIAKLSNCNNIAVSTNCFHIPMTWRLLVGFMMFHRIIVLILLKGRFFVIFLINLLVSCILFVYCIMGSLSV